MGALASRRPLVLALEDLHWVDPTTTAVLTFLLEHLAGARVLLLCTYRPDFASLWSRKSYHSVITLQPLDPRQGHEMLTALLGTPRMQDELAALVLNKAEGVPFFLEELVKALRETGAIALRGEQWQLTTSAIAVPVPDTVEEVLMARIDRLPEGAKEVLQVGAVIGREFRTELLGEVAATQEAQLVTHLAALTEAELLYVRGLPPQTTYLFKHAFTQEAAYRSVLTARRRELHYGVALTLEGLFPDRLEEYYGQLAHHYLEAGQPAARAQAIMYAIRAGERHMALPAYAEAARFYHMALQALEDEAPVDEAQRCPLLRALGVAQRKAGNHTQACDTLHRAVDSARRLQAAEDFSQAALEFEQTAWVGKLPAEPASPLLEEALQQLSDDDSALRARVLGGFARALLFTGMVEQAAAYAQQAVEMARRVSDPSVLAFNLHVVLHFSGRPEKAEERLAYATEMLLLARQAHEEELVCVAHGWRMLALLELGDMPGVDAEIDAYGQSAEKLLEPVYFYFITGYRTMRALLVGDFATAERLALQGLAIGQQTNVAAEGTFGVQMFTLRQAQGRLQEVEPALRHFIRQHGAASTWRPGLALVYSELGRERETRLEFERLAQHDFADLPRDTLWEGCITYLAEVCAFLRDAARAAILYRLLLPYAGRTVTVAGQIACGGAACRYLGMLAATMARWDEAEQHFTDAVAMNARMGARPWLAYTQHDYAQMLLSRAQHGDDTKAVALLQEALNTAQELGMRALEGRITGQHKARDVAVPVPQGPADPLSQREVEVLRLVAAGKSNREIAAALSISLNTVATHVRNILTKIGAANRAEAAAYAVRHGVLPG